MKNKCFTLINKIESKKKTLVRHMKTSITIHHLLIQKEAIKFFISMENIPYASCNGFNVSPMFFFDSILFIKVKHLFFILPTYTIATIFISWHHCGKDPWLMHLSDTPMRLITRIISVFIEYCVFGT